MADLPTNRPPVQPVAPSQSYGGYNLFNLPDSALKFSNQLGQLGNQLYMMDLQRSDPELYKTLAEKQLQEQQMMQNQQAQQQEFGLRKDEIDIRKQERAAQIAEQRRIEQQRAQQQSVLGSLSGVIAQRTGLPPEQVSQLIQSGADLGTLGSLQDIITPEMTDFEEKMQTLGALQNMTPEQKDLYLQAYGKGGTTVNVGGSESPFAEKFSEELGKERVKQITTLETEAADYLTQATSSEQALALLEASPDMAINPLAPVSNQVKSLFAPFLDEEELKNVADFQTLESQLIRNRFDVTKVLKGAITEQEQQAAQQVAGKATGTRQGLEKTLRNNIAYSTLIADEKERRAQFIMDQGENYSPQKFNEYYKELGETGQRPTLDGLIKQFGGVEKPMTATGPNGQKLILKDGQWQPIQ